LANTLGVAGFTSGEAYKIGQAYPYARLPRAFIRQTIDLGGATEKVEAGTAQFAGSQTANRLVLTIGKLSVVDIFDTNKYAHDPRTDFLNWAIVDTGTFDYAADAWGYTYGAAAEGIRETGLCARACSISRSCPTAPISIPHSSNFSRSAKSNVAIPYGTILVKFM
jgi:high affinity Mn2+ porin